MASDEKAPAVPTEENEDELDDLLCSELFFFIFFYLLHDVYGT